MEFKVHSGLEILARAGVKNRSDVVFLRGLVAQTRKNSVTIKADAFGGSKYEISIEDIITAKDNPDGSVTLLVRDSAAVVIHTTAGVLQMANDNRAPTKAEVDECAKAGRERCIKNRILAGSPPDKAAEGCDDPIVSGLREAICKQKLRVGGQAPGPEVVGGVGDFF